MPISFELLSKNSLEYLRNIRNQNREWFINSKEISEEDQIDWYINHRLLFPNDLIFIIRNTGINTRVGIISIYNIDHDNHIANIGRMMVDNNYKHQGYMERAMLKCFRLCEDYLNINALKLEVKLANIPARDLYAKMGFITIGYSSEVLTMKKEFK